jgi:cytochrome b6-f complex iron-sulfur subunit
MAGATTALCCGVGITTLFESCVSVAQIQVPIIDNSLKLDASVFQDKDYVVIKNDRFPAPIYIHKENGSYKASLMLCTHRNCELNVTGSFLSCPCHGSEFSNKGKVLTGPADKDLQRFKLRVEGSTIIIDLT